MSTQSQIILDTKQWLENIVIGLNLCPFAKKEYVKERVRFVVCEDEDETNLLFSLSQELEFVFANDDIETSLIILSNVLQDFNDYNQFLDLADALIAKMDFEGEFQIASFHPAYQFADTDFDDVENYTNRSPYPILHILREASLEKAIDSYPKVDDIPEKNIALLKAMGLEKIKAVLNG